MAKDIQTIKTQFQVIQNETIEDANTAARVGGAGYDLADFVGENRTGIIPFFDSESDLNAAIPTPNDGGQAWAGSPYPGTVWSAIGGVWSDTGVIPDVNGVDLTQYAKKENLSLTPKIQTIATVGTYTWYKPSNIRLRTSNYVRVKQGAEITFHLNSSYQISIFTYNEHLALVEQFNFWLSNGDKVILYQPYAQWQIRKANDGTINISDLTEIALSISGSVPDFEIAPSVTEVLPVITAFPAVQTKVNNVNLIQAVNTISNFGSWKQGGVADAEGSKLNVISPRNKLRNTTGSTTILTINTAYRIALIYYNEDLTQTGSSGWITNGGTFTVNYPYFGFNLARVDGGNVLVSDLATVNISLSGSIALYDIAASNLQLQDLKSKLITGSFKIKNIDLGHLAYQPIGNKTNSIIFYYGQSESDGTETGGVATTTAIAGNYMIGNSPNIEAAGANPVLNPLIATLFSASYTGGEQPIVACTNSFSQLYRKYIDGNQKFIAASCGRGSASITKLLDDSPTGLYTTNFMYALNKAVELTANNVDCSYIVYIQGEADYGTDPDAINDKNGYKAALLTLKNKMQADIMTKTGQSNPPLFFIYQTSTGFIQNDTLSISMAQFEFAEENSDVILLNGIYPVTRYNNSNYRAHLSINGSRWFGEMAAKTIFQTLVNGKDYSTVKPLNTYIAGNEIHINMHVPVPPLVIDTYTVPSVANYGFKVTYDGINQTISSVSVKGNDIVLTMQNTPSGTVALTYCPQSTNGRGNIRDSDGFMSMYKFIEDSSEISRWGNAIGYRAKDKSGNYMTGKNYPLANWMSPYYKEMTI